MRQGLNRLRRAVVLAMVLMMAPGIALAAFQPTASARLTVGSAALATPSTVSYTRTCPFLIVFGGSVRVHSFTEVPLADGYEVRLTRSGQLVDSEHVPSSRTVNFTINRSGSYELSVTPTLKSWSAPPVVRTFTC